MLEPISLHARPAIANEAFVRHAQRYLDIESDFYQAIGELGVEVSEEVDDFDAHVERMRDVGVRVENDRKSFHVGWMSPACAACRKGVGTETFLAPTQCPRSCFFCFNPNQDNYEHGLVHVSDIAGELRQRIESGARYDQLAVTGGEPLLHVDAVIAFLDAARTHAPGARVRLYTSGTGLTAELACELADAGLGVRGVNLLELCFPFHNAHEFARRGYRIQRRPYRVPYDYWYAGGLPIAGSERACFELLEFAVREKLTLGVHYCSLENKLTGQVYQQNRFIATGSACHVQSPDDFFLKSAKVFGPDRTPVRAWLEAASERSLRDSDGHDYLEFPASCIPGLQAAFSDMEI